MLEIFYGRNESAGVVSKGSITGWREDVDIYIVDFDFFQERIGQGLHVVDIHAIS